MSVICAAGRAESMPKDKPIVNDAAPEKGKKSRKKA